MLPLRPEQPRHVLPRHASGVCGAAQAQARSRVSQAAGVSVAGGGAPPKRKRPPRGHFEQAAPLEIVLRAPPLPLNLPLLHRAQLLLLLRLSLAQRLALVGELTNPLPLVLELAAELWIR